MRLSLTLALLLVACSSDDGVADGGDAAVAPDAGTDAPEVIDEGVDLPVCTTEWDAAEPAADLGTFMTAAHPPLAHVGDVGGHVCAHPQVVTISYRGDSNAAGYEAFADFAVTSSWLTDVGTEYGVGTGSVAAKLRIPGTGPGMITDDEIKQAIVQQIELGNLPEAVGDPNDLVYMFYFPPTTRVVGMDGRPSCPLSPGAFVAGYHYEYEDAVRHFSYAVIAGCALGQTVNDYELTASHELIEAATDPYVVTDKAYRLNDAYDAWGLDGGELGDLCAGKSVMSCGHALTRVWSNAAALGGGPPCVPVPAGEPYFNASIPTTRMQSVTPGQVLMFPVTGFSDRPLADWFVIAGEYDPASTFMPGVAPTTFASNNGSTTTLTITVPLSAPSGSYATVYVYSSPTRAMLSTNNNLWPIGLYVP